MIVALPEYSIDDVVVFVGYAGDAREEVRVILSTEEVLQKNLDRYRQANGGRGPARVRFFEWESQARNEVGGQRQVIDPVIGRANIGLFVFRHRIGEVTWQEFNSFRARTTSSVAVIALFPNKPASDVNFSDLDFVTDWQDLLRKKKSLTDEWVKPQGVSVTPVPDYSSHSHLREIVIDRLDRVILDLISKAKGVEPLAGQEAIILRGDNSLNFINRVTNLKEFDAELVQEFRGRLRSDIRQDFPSSLPAARFLESWGFLKDGYLTIGGALFLFDSPVPL